MRQLKWKIVRARVRLARLIWPSIDPLPSLFIASGGTVHIHSFNLYDDGDLLGNVPTNIALQNGDTFSVLHEIEVITDAGERARLMAQLVPCDGVPMKLYAARSA